MTTRQKLSIKKLRAEAMKRFEGHNEVDKTIVLFCHHGSFAEILREPIENRLDYIIKEKPKNEIETRLTWIQPYLPQSRTADAEWRKADKAWEKADKAWKKARAEFQKIYEPIFMAAHPDCPWNGHELVFHK